MQKPIYMKTISFVFLFGCIVLQSCKAQQPKTDVLKVENHLKGTLDYVSDALNLVHTQVNEEVGIGTINTNGTINFKFLEYDIKGLHESINLSPVKLQHWFSIDSGCKDKDVFAATPYDQVYSEKSKALFVKKYGINVAVLEAITKIENETRTYFWFYIDSAIHYKEECTKENNSTGDIYEYVSVDIAFEKGWNFIEEHKTYAINNEGPTKTKYSKVLPTNNKVKWTLRQIQEDEKIATAKRLYNLTPLIKEQFENWVPQSLNDLMLVKQEYGNPPQGQKNKNNIQLTYANKEKTKEIKVYIIDAAKNPDDMEMIDFVFAMENDGKDKKDIKPYVAQYSKRQKATQLLFKVEERIVVNALATHMTGEELWSYIQKLKVEQL